MGVCRAGGRGWGDGVGLRDRGQVGTWGDLGGRGKKGDKGHLGGWGRGTGG